jgi:CRISPR/Cas system Type II protein with McrA/HNH and RuvC-like nuclease domain
MSKVLVLNFDYTPLNVTSLQRGFVLVDKGKAEIVKADETPIITSYKNYVRPIIIRLLKFINFRNRGFRVNRNRIFRRDNHECVYCGSKRDLTIDHVFPRSRGGRNTWTNLTTCCQKCNLKKGDKTPEEARMQLRVKPYDPGYIAESSVIMEAWESLQNSFFS